MNGTAIWQVTEPDCDTFSFYTIEPQKVFTEFTKIEVNLGLSHSFSLLTWKCPEPRNPYCRVRVNTVDLLVQTSLEQPFFILKLFHLFTKSST
jgi:hypothetical protein